MSLPLTQLLGACWLAGLLSLSAFPAAASANGSAWLLRSWLKENGLPDNKVTGLVQTPDGFLWVGTTPTGLARFDGVHFTEFSSSNFVSAPNRGIVAMIGDGSGGLRMAMDRGALVLMNREKVRTFLAGHGFPDLAPFMVVEDGEKSLWMSYRAGAVCKLKDDNVTCYGATDGLPETNAVCFLASDRNGQIWFAKAGEVGVFRSGRFQSLLHLDREPTGLTAARDGGVWICSGFHLFKFLEGGKPQDLGPLTENLSGVGTEQDVLLEDHEGAVWIGTTFSGLFRFNGAGFERVPTTHSGVLSLAEGAQGSLWVGTDGGGLNQVRPRAVDLEGTESGLPFEAVQSLTQETNGTIWAVTQNGALARRAGKRWEPMAKGDGWQEDATCILEGRAGELWVGTRYHGLLCWRTNGFIQVPGLGRTRGQTVLTLLVARYGDVYLGEATPNAIERFRNGHLESLALPADDVRSIRAVAEDSAGNIWFGTSKGVLLRVAGERALDQTSLIGGTPLSIRCLYPTPDGALWIGFAGFGLGRIKEGNFRRIGTGEGLHDDYISQILLDEKGWLWFGSGGGLFKVRQRDLDAVADGRATRVQSVHYGQSEGLAGLQANFGVSPACLRTSDGRLWMPTRTALAIIDPERVGENLQPVSVLLTRVNVADRTVAWYGGALPAANVIGPGTVDLAAGKAALKLPPDHRRLEFEFTAPTFVGAENIRFRYRIEGLDDTWVESTTRSVPFARLSAGDYHFEISASGNEGEWSPAASVGISVARFFWQTWWFRISALVIFTAGIAAIVRYVSFRRLHRRLQQLEQQAALHQERARIAKDIHDDLGANLTQIALLGDLAQQDRGAPEKAGEHVGKISVTARQLIKSLDEIVWAVNPRNDTLAHLVDYTGQFALDYLRVAGIRCRLDFPDQVPARELSTDIRHDLFLIVKEALHNIVKHARATEVWLRLRATDSFLRLSVEDNGCGFDQPPGHAGADGLLNMRQRAAEIGGACRIESKPGEGTKIIVELQWSNRSNSHPHTSGAVDK